MVQKKFNMGFWIKTKNSAGAETVIKRGHLTTECGSAGCLIGWLPTIFPGEFKIRERHSNISIYDDLDDLFDIHEIHTRDTNLSAAAKFFDINLPDIQELSLPDKYFTTYTKIEPKHVAERIDKILQEEQS